MTFYQKSTNGQECLVWRAFWLPKRGNSPDEYEDAFAANPALGRFAVADGASESVFAGLWARLLVEQYVRNQDLATKDWHEYLPDVQERWLQELSSRPLQWHAEEKFLHGSFATFLGVEIVAHAARLYWEAVAVGDSCLFHIRDNHLLCAWPIDSSQRFDNAPMLVGSRTPKDEINFARALWKLVPPRGDQQLRLHSGDRLWLTTDALAQWFLAEWESGRRPWREIDAALRPQLDEPSPICRSPDAASSLGEASRAHVRHSPCEDHSAGATYGGDALAARSDRPAHETDQVRFQQWIAKLRTSGKLRNDDVTLVEVLVP